MITFLVRRILTGVAILVVGSAISYWLVNVAIDPLADLEESTNPNKGELIAQRTASLRLDEPWFVRYWDWLTHVVRGDFGRSWRTNTPVIDLLKEASVNTLQLVTAATLLAVILGVGVGVISALRQYTGFDYLITTFTFLMYSLPAFWVAVLLKQWGAIGFNDFLQDPSVPPWVIALIALLAGALWALAMAGSPARRLLQGLIAAAITAAILIFLNLTDWWARPGVAFEVGGVKIPILLALTALAVAVGVTTLAAGVQNRRALGTALTLAGLAVVGYWPLNTLFTSITPTMDWGHLFVALLGAVAVGLLVGWAWGGPDRGQNLRVGVLTALPLGVVLLADKVFSYWPQYTSALGGRPVPTIGATTPNLTGNFWVQLLDIGTHLILPTISLMLISFAVYTRYSRGSMLEVLGQDYIRTARAKGLSERTVVMRHGFRNALIPLATIVPLDVAGLLGGAIITEGIFGRPGLGQLFLHNISRAVSDINPVMAYVVLTAALAVLANLISDLIYAALDPRIRVTS